MLTSETAGFVPLLSRQRKRILHRERPGRLCRHAVRWDADFRSFPAEQPVTLPQRPCNICGLNYMFLPQFM